MRFATSLLLAVSLAAMTGALAATAVPDSATAPTPRAAPLAPPVPLLWKVSDADNSVYLLGSFHLLRPSDYPLSKDVDAAFADAEQVVFEMSPEEMASPALAMQMGQAALRLDGTRLDSELPPATAGKLKNWLVANAAEIQKSGMPADMLQMFEPWFVGLTITLVEMGKQGLDPKLGLDAYFAKAARDARKKTAGFETGAQQIAFLDGMGRQEQLQFLDEALSDSGDAGKETRELHEAWRNGDEKAMWDGMAAEMRRDYPQLYRRINVERNDAWLPKIEQRLKASRSEDTLVVVGALHLLGGDGVVEKLRAQGYAVERICSACRARAPASKKK